MRELRTLAVASGLLFALSLCSPSQSPGAGDLLKKVSEAYTNLKSYHFEVRATRSFNTPGRYISPEESRTVLAVAAPDRLHFEIRAQQNNQLTVSDGATTWTYLPQYKQYTKEDGALSDVSADAEPSEDSEDEDPVVTARFQLVTRFQNIAQEGKTAQLLPDEEIEVGGQKISCAVIELKLDTGGFQVSPVEQLWIDPKRNLVLKTVLKSKRPVRNQQVSTIDTREWTVARTDQSPDDDLFTFQPPRGVKLVQVLDTPFKPADWRGKTAADFTLKSLEGDEVSLNSLRGKVVLMSFWASWCGPCRHELPALANLETEMGGRGLVVLGINDEKGFAARNFLQNHNLTLRTLADPKHAVHKLYGVHSIPTLVVVNREGTVVCHFHGAVPENIIRGALKQAGLE